MDFFTRVQVAPPPHPICLHNKILSLGSCFAQAVGSRMAACCFDINVNPAGTLYNPESIALVLEERWHEPWAQTPHFNWLMSAECTGVPDGTALSYDTLLITFGTSHVYRLADGHVVANCHKQPAHTFTEDELSVNDIVQRYCALIPQLRDKHPGLQVIFTVSPYRYMKYGLHGSALSKARLLLAVDEICHKVEGCHYFPAYEIVTDELRDYRFYEADMVHPNAVAADYVWQRFQATFLSDEAQRFVQEYTPIRRAMEHRPLHPDSSEYHVFITKTQEQRNALLTRYGIPNR